MPFGHRAGPEDQRAAAAESSGSRRGHIDGGRADRPWVAAEHRLPPHAASGGQRADEDGIEHTVGGPGRSRRLIGPTNLPQDLALTQDLGVEAGRDGIEMPHRGRAIEPGHGVMAAGIPGAREVLEPLAKIVLAGPVHLEAIAGGKEHGAPACQPLGRQPCVPLRRSQREVLPHLDAGGMVAHTNDMERRFVAHDPTVPHPGEDGNPRRPRAASVGLRTGNVTTPVRG